MHLILFTSPSTKFWSQKENEKSLDKHLYIMYIRYAMRNQQVINVSKQCSHCGSWNELRVRGWEEGITFLAPKLCRCGHKVYWDEDDLLIIKAESEGTRPYK